MGGGVGVAAGIPSLFLHLLLAVSAAPVALPVLGISAGFSSLRDQGQRKLGLAWPPYDAAGTHGHTDCCGLPERESLRERDPGAQGENLSANGE